MSPNRSNQVIAGQGTIGMEILKERNGRALDIVFCCCGGGGLVAGVAAYIKQVRPEVKVGFVRPSSCISAADSFAAGLASCSRWWGNLMLLLN